VDASIAHLIAYLIDASMSSPELLTKGPPRSRGGVGLRRPDGRRADGPSRRRHVRRPGGRPGERTRAARPRRLHALLILRRPPDDSRLAGHGPARPGPPPRPMAPLGRQSDTGRRMPLSSASATTPPSRWFLGGRSGRRTCSTSTSPPATS
jgi:hypothetical protein